MLEQRMAVMFYGGTHFKTQIVADLVFMRI